MNTVYSDSRKQKLGENIERFLLDRSSWSDSLQNYFDDLDPKERSRGLTLELLLTWMAAETGIKELGDPYYMSSFVRLLGHYKRWSHNTARGGDSFVLLTALAQCGVVRKDDGTPITDPAELIAFLFGRSQG